MGTLAFGGIQVETESPWQEYEDETLAHLQFMLVSATETRGVLQFSIAHYVGGRRPTLSPAQLLQVSRAAGEENGWGPPFDEETHEGALRIGAASFRAEDAIVRFWTVSDGWNFARVCYTGGEDPLDLAELKEAEAIVRSLRFLPAPQVAAA